MSVRPARVAFACALWLALAQVAGAAAGAASVPRITTLEGARSAEGYDGAERARRCAADAVRAVLAESLAVAPPGAAGAVERAWGDAVRALRRGDDDAAALAALRACAGPPGDARAAQLLGLLYTAGERVARDDAAAVRWYERATHAGAGCEVALSHAQLAHAYFAGLGVPRSDSLAGRAVTSASSAASHAECRARLGERDHWLASQGLFYIAGETRLRGEGVRVDVPGALYQFDKGVRFGEGACALRAAMLFLPSPHGDPAAQGRLQPDAGRAAGFLESARQAGVDAATLVLARCVAEGVIGPPDPARALELFEQAAERGVAGARFELAARLSGGNGLAPDSARGLRELERSAREGDAVAMGVMGRLALDASRAARRAPAARLAEAADWFRRGAEAGDPYSMHELALLYERGGPLPRDPALAAEWHSRARAAGWPDGR